MKVPFRQQASEYDCVPTTFLNALSFLFERREIPPQVVQRIYLYSLDAVTSSKGVGHGTSGLAIQLLGNWLAKFKYSKFLVQTEFISGESVHLRKGNKIARTLGDGGVALLRVKHAGNAWHYVLAISISGGWLYCYDPYARTPKAGKPDKYEFLETNDAQGPNLRISSKWLDTNSNKNPYQFGTLTDRECLIIKRISKQ